MLLMGMQKKNSDMDSLMEHLEFKGINVLNVFEEGRVNNLLWQMNTRKNNELFIKHRYVVLFISYEMLNDIKGVYYLELVKKLSEMFSTLSNREEIIVLVSLQGYFLSST